MTVRERCWCLDCGGLLRGVWFLKNGSSLAVFSFEVGREAGPAGDLWVLGAL